LHNIGPRERRKRLRFGAIAFAAGVAIGFLLIVTGAPPLWRLSLFLPLFVAALGYFQARDRT